tara:strand:+ start:688 stop:1044 length:357 start_codon:yes stop_codon:yes gene_type:complete
MAQKLYDVTVKTGEYTNNQGETKGRYENIGTMMQGDNGPFLILKRTFNPAGVPNPDNKDSVICSCFEPQQQNNNQQMNQQQNQGGFNQQGNNNQQQGNFAPQQQGGGFNPQPQGNFQQ